MHKGVISIATPIKFGTDGWRGIIAEDFTFDNVRACAQGYADYLKGAGVAGRGIVIGYDTRFESEDFAAATAEVLAGNGIRTFLCQRATPTPLVSFGVVHRKAAGGIVITASHNPAVYNGFKIKSAEGNSAPEEITCPVEDNINVVAASGKVARLPLSQARKQGLVEDVDLAPEYFDAIGKLVDGQALRDSGLKIVVDPMRGAGCGYLKHVLGGGRTQLVQINGERNPLFPGIERPEPIAVNLKALSEAVRREKAIVGLALDGDADRMGIMDENGNFLTQLQVFALLCLYLLDTRGQRGPIVKTLTTTSMADRLGEIYNVPVFETAVGFKYVAPVMKRENALIGGEESGGYGFRGHVLERDGILANLYFLDFIRRTGKTPSQLIEYLYSKVGPHYYEREDFTFPADQRQAILGRIENSGLKAIDGTPVSRLDRRDGFRFILADNSWLLIRFSGTEPVLRIYSETSSVERAKSLVQFGRKLAGVEASGC